MQHLSHRSLPALLCLACVMAALAEDAAAREPRGLLPIQELVNELKGRLGIQEAVTAVIVPANPLLVSVQPIDRDTGSFEMAFDERFLTALDQDDLSAIVAHELGHVWIFTHHPYLQTERLANSVAMRAVSRESLERVYSKMWERQGTKGDLVRFLGPQN